MPKVPPQKADGPFINPYISHPHAAPGGLTSLDAAAANLQTRASLEQS